MKRSLLAIIIFLSLKIGAQNCLSNWQYFQSVNIVNSSSVTLTEYQLKITVNTSALISSGKMMANGNDMRFSLATSCCSIIPYYIESGINTASTVVWVRIPSVPVGSSSIKLFYGNLGSPPASSAAEVFDLWEDFNAASNHFVTKCGAGTANQSSSQMTYGWSSSGIWECDSVFQLGHSFTAEANVITATGNWPGLYWKKTTGHSYSMLMGGGQVRIAKTSSVAAFPADCAGHNWANTPQNYTSPAGIWSLTWINTGDIQGSFPGVGTMTSTDTENAKNTPLKVGLGGVASAPGSISVDWLRVRKWAQIVPSISGFGSEQVNPAIALSVSASNNGFCEGQSTSLTASGSPTYTWNNGATGAVINITPSVTTNYTVTASNINGCEKSAVTTVTVYPYPVVSVTGATMACTNQPALLTATGANSYTWSTGATTSTISANINTNTTYTVYGETGAGCTSSVVQTVIVSVTPTVAVNGLGSICAGNNVTIAASGADGYSWNTGAVTSSIIVAPNSTTSYTVTGINFNGNCAATAVHNVSVTSASLSASSNSTCVDGPAINLNGVPSGGIYSGLYVSGNTFVPPSTNGNYAVTYVVTNTLLSCSNAATLTLIVSPCTGIGENVNAVEHISVYPNPSNSLITIVLNNSEEKTIEIYDALGKAVISIQSAESNINTDISALSNGIYFLKVKTGAKLQTGRLVKN